MGFVSRDPGAYMITITAAGSREPLARFAADLTDVSGRGVNVLAAGFLDPEANRDGPALTTFATTAEGDSLTLTPVAIDNGPLANQ